MGYNFNVDKKVVVWLHGEINVPPFSTGAAEEAFNLIEDLREGKKLSLPRSRPMPSIGKRCHELRIQDEHQTWRIFYRTDADAIIITEIIAKKTQQTPLSVINNSKKRLRMYDAED